jgi:NAD(P)H-dependent FMN reductase
VSSDPRLMIIVTSTRPVRVGRTVADWLHAHAEAHGGFDIDFVDLAELNLPLMDEPNHPRLATYTKQHTLDWSARVDAADAFVFVMAEYNHGYTAALKNAIDYLLREWAYKPVGFVSYGGVAGGTRAVQAIKPVCVVIKMWPLTEAVYIPWVAKHVEDGVFKATEELETQAAAMLNELQRVTEALVPLRAPKPAP